MQRLTHACSAGTDAPAKANAPATVRGTRDTHGNSRWCGDAGKAYATLRARLELAAFTLHPAHLEQGAATAYIVTRWALSRTLPDLAAVAAFLEQVGVRNG